MMDGEAFDVDGGKAGYIGPFNAYRQSKETARRRIERSTGIFYMGIRSSSFMLVALNLIYEHASSRRLYSTWKTCVRLTLVGRRNYQDKGRRVEREISPV